MLATVRLGAVHSVVFGGFAAASLADAHRRRASRQVMVTADAGMRGGKAVPYKHLVDEALRLAKHPPAKVIIVDRGLDPAMSRTPGPRSRLRDARAPARGREAFPARGSNPRSPRTSSTPRARRASPRACSAIPAATRSRWPPRCATSSASQPGETMFTDQRHRLGGRAFVHRLRAAPERLDHDHVRGPADPSRPGHLVADRRRAQGGARCSARRPRSACSRSRTRAYMKKHDLSLPALPVPRRRAARRADRALGIGFARRGDRRSTTGRPRAAGRSCRASPGSRTRRASSAVRPSRCAATTCGCSTRRPASEVGTDRRACSRIMPPLPPGCMTTVWGDDERFVEDLLHDVARTSWSYSTFDWAHARRRRLLLRARPHRRRDQRRRPPPRHARDRGGRAGASGHRRSRGGRRCGSRSRARCPVAFAVVKDPSRSRDGGRRREPCARR